MKKLSPKTGYNPKTAARPENRPTRPVLSNAATTSADAQRLIRQSPAYPTLKPVGTNPAYRAPTGLSAFARSTVDKFRTVSVRNMPDPSFAAVGYSPNATKPNFQRGRSIISGNPTRGNTRSAGRISTNATPLASAKEVRRVRSQYPGIGVGKWRP